MYSTLRDRAQPSPCFTLVITPVSNLLLNLRALLFSVSRPLGGCVLLRYALITDGAIFDLRPLFQARN